MLFSVDPPWSMKFRVILRDLCAFAWQLFDPVAQLEQHDSVAAFLGRRAQASCQLLDSGDRFLCDWDGHGTLSPISTRIRVEKVQVVREKPRG